MIDVIINDAIQQIPEGTTVESLLRRLGLQTRFLAVEVNGSVVPRREHTGTLLSKDDRIEIVTLVGGG